MKRPRLSWLLILGGMALLAGACQLVLLGDMRLSWTVNGAATPTQSLCLSYGITNWEIVAEGPAYRELTVPCGNVWNTGEQFYRIEEGNYTITISALNQYDQVLAQKSRTVSLVSGSANGVLTPEVFNFVAADFNTEFTCGDGVCSTDKGESCTTCTQDCGPCAQAKILLSWNINGSINGLSTGESFDKCADVGATKVAVTVDSSTYYLDCAAMAGEIAVTPGSHSVKMKLVNSNNADLTQNMPLNDSLIVTANVGTPGTVPTVEFYYDKFLNWQNYRGDFLFQTTFESGKTCSATLPAVGYRMVLLTATDGTTLITGAQVCDTMGNCKSASGAFDQSLVCNTDVTLKIPNLVWGKYKIKIQGATTQANTCWETTQEILVGAGSCPASGSCSVNPIKIIDVSRLSGRACY